jgi:hypothetical protein
MPGAGELDLEGAKVRTRRRPARTGGRPMVHHAPEALQRRISSVLVMRTQVQPVSLQMRSSLVPGAP